MFPSRSTPAVAPSPRATAGTASAGEPPLAPAAGSSPCPAALCALPQAGQEQPGSRSRKPAAATTSRFSFSFFSVFEIPLWDRAVWRSQCQKRQKKQKSPCSLPLSSAPTGAPPAPSLPRPATSAAAGGGGRAGPAARAGPREEGGLAFVTRSPSGCVKRRIVVKGQRHAAAGPSRAPGFSNPARGAAMPAPHGPRRGGRSGARRDPAGGAGPERRARLQQRFPQGRRHLRVRAEAEKG